MYGVVLWRDSKCNRAVIWCEDHRNLAFFSEDIGGLGASGTRAAFEPGDLVAFDLREENDLRLAVDPYVVAPHEFPSLATDLKSAFEGLSGEDVSASQVRSAVAQSGRVVRLFADAEAGQPAPLSPVRHCG